MRTADPYLAFARAVELFYVPPPRVPGIHTTAIIASSASVAADASIGPYCVIGDRVVIGAGAHLDAHVVIYPDVRIGTHFRAYARAVVENAARSQYLRRANAELHRRLDERFGFEGVIGNSQQMQDVIIAYLKRLAGPDRRTATRAF